MSSALDALAPFNVPVSDQPDEELLVALNLAGLETNIGPGQHALFQHVMRHECRRFVFDPSLPVDAVSRLDSVSRSTIPFSHPTSLLSRSLSSPGTTELRRVHLDHRIQGAHHHHFLAAGTAAMSSAVLTLCPRSVKLDP